MSIPARKKIEGKYEILAKLSEGGMGAVYKVRHRLLDEVRVIKVILPQFQQDPELEQRFLREARSAVKLRHPNIAQVHDFSIDDDDTAFMVMEFIEGHNLAEVLAHSGPVKIETALEVGIQTLRALSYLHRSDFVHRDVSPDNLILGKDVEGQTRIKLIDLGIAKSLTETGKLTKEGLFLGKLRYASPEQLGGADGKAEIDQRSDLYALGIVLYELVTGSMPIGGDDYRSLLAGHLMHPPRSFDETDPANRVPDSLRTVILKALEKEPDQRFSDANEFSRALMTIRDDWIEPDVPAQAIQPTVVMARKIEPRVKPGSTQERLDRHFDLEPTPQPGLHKVPTDPEQEPTRRLQSPSKPDSVEPLATVEPESRGSETGARAEHESIVSDRTAIPSSAYGPKRTLLFGSIAGVVLLATGGLWLFLSRQESPQPTMDTDPVQESSLETSSDRLARSSDESIPPSKQLESTSVADQDPAKDADDIGQSEVKDHGVAQAGSETLMTPVATPQRSGPQPTQTPSTPAKEAKPPGDPTKDEANQLAKRARGVQESGDRTRALDLASQSLSLDPGNDAATTVISQVVNDLREEMLEARGLAKAAGASSQNSEQYSQASARMRMADAKIRNNDWTEAVSLYESSSRLFNFALQTAQSQPPAPQPAQPVPQVQPQAPPKLEQTQPATTQAAPDQPTNGTPEDEIASVLTKFAAAHENRNMAALKAVWPSMSGDRYETISRSITTAESIQFELKGCWISLSDAKAKAKCKMVQKIRPKVGAEQTIKRQVVFQLERDDSRWLISTFR